jgi:hypothetical protein
MNRVDTPFTEDQVRELNAYQDRGEFHPFTCGTDSNHPNLVATANGWICTACAYTQNWAHGFMAANPTSLRMTKSEASDG